MHPQFQSKKLAIKYILLYGQNLILQLVDHQLHDPFVLDQGHLLSLLEGCLLKLNENLALFPKINHN